MKMKYRKLLVILLIAIIGFSCVTTNAQFAGGYRGRYSGPLEAQDIKYENALVVQPDKYKVAATLQGAYDWLKSSARDGEMGVLAYDNPRTLIFLPGKYVLLAALACDTSFVNLTGMTGAKEDVVISVSDAVDGIQQTAFVMSMANLTIRSAAAGTLRLIEISNAKIGSGAKIGRAHV